jgi:ABC-type histidine transport system ATPase subunit
MTAAEETLRLEDVHKSFGRLEVLRGIDLSVAEHEKKRKRTPSSFFAVSGSPTSATSIPTALRFSR